MAQQADGGNFWLPAELLTDDARLMGFKTKRFNDFQHGYANSFGFSSDLSSPAESVLGSAETESDEDEFVTGLTQKLAYATLLGDSNLSAENTVVWKFSGSPQSTLCSTVTGCGCMPGLSRVSRVSLPPDCENAAAWHSLLAAVGRGARIRLNEETAAFCSGNPFACSRKPVSTDPIQGYTNQPPVSYQQLQAAKFQQLKQQQQAVSFWEQGKKDYQQMLRNVKKNGGSGNQSLSMASYPDIQRRQPQRQLSSGMKAVFLGETETKSKRTGTGVFFPRNMRQTSVETRKKTGCPVLLSDRVQALNLNLRSIGLQQPQSLAKISDSSEANAALKHGHTVSISEQRRTLRPVPPARMNQELRLPQEWTY